MDFHLIFCLTISDIITIFEILVTAILGVWIAVFVQKNFTINRNLKQYFIKEIEVIKEKQSLFFDELYSGKISSKNIAEWFKVMTIRIETFQDLATNEYKIEPKVLLHHNEIKHFVTSRPELSDQFNESQVLLNVSSKNELLNLYGRITKSLVQLVVDINKAKKR